MSGDLSLRSKFWGKGVEAIFGGDIHLKFPGTGDHFVWRKATCCVHNIILGNIWVEWHGDVTVANLTTGDVATVRMPKCNRMPGRRGYITGQVVTSDDRVAYNLQAAAPLTCPDLAPPFTSGRAFPEPPPPPAGQLPRSDHSRTPWQAPRQQGLSAAALCEAPCPPSGRRAVQLHCLHVGAQAPCRCGYREAPADRLAFASGCEGPGAGEGPS